MTRLTELDAKFITWHKKAVDPTQFIDGIMHTSGYELSYAYCDSIHDAHGIVFTCPLCKDTDGHSVMCWFEGRVPDEAEPKPGRWTPSPQSTGIDDLTFVPGVRIAATSVLLLGGCNWHGFVNNGDAT